MKKTTSKSKNPFGGKQAKPFGGGKPKKSPQTPTIKNTGMQLPKAMSYVGT